MCSFLSLGKSQLHRDAMQSCNFQEGWVAQAEGGSEEAANGDAESISFGNSFPQTINDGMSLATFSSYLTLYRYSLLSTAGVERGFSTMNRIFHRLRTMGRVWQHSPAIWHLYSHSPLPVLRETSPPWRRPRLTGGASSTPALCPNWYVSGLKAQTTVSTTVCELFREAGRSKRLTWCFTPSQPVWSHQGKTRSVNNQLWYKEELWSRQMQENGWLDRNQLQEGSWKQRHRGESFGNEIEVKGSVDGN